MQVARAAFTLLLLSLFTTPALAATCPAEKFEDFLKLFTESADIQKQFTRYPFVQARVVDDGKEPEPHVVTTLQQENQITFPLMPTAYEQEDQGLEHRIKIRGDQAVVYYHKPDTSYQFRLYFTKDDGCWKLTRQEDDSI